MNKCIPIHLHTAEGSLKDSIVLTDDLMKRAKELNINTLCLTDHGSLSNMYNFYYKCIENNIKPIIGCEIYLVEDMTLKDKEHRKSYHMILLAKNNNGLKNLLKIVSYASTEGVYYKPRIDLDFIKQNCEDLICTTACVGGYAPQLIINEEYEKAEEHIRELKDIFKEDLYLEIQPGTFEEQTKVNEYMIKYSEKYNIKLVASNDIHYINKEDWKAHDFHVRDGRREQVPENPDDIIYADKCYYLMTYEELFNSFTNIDKKYVKQAIDNTNIIDVSCETLVFNQEKLNLPVFKCPNNYTPLEYLEHICFQRLNNIIYKIKNPNEYVTRLYYELDVINKLDYVSYFLIMRDIVMYAKKNNIKVGPGRGSAAGSLVAYLCQITKIDPVKYGLLFERFLSVHRKGSIPDVDLDISSEGRDELFKYVIDKYGNSHCCAVSTLGIRKAKSAIKCAGRLLGMEASLQNDISKLIPTVYYIDLEDGEDKKTDLSIEESLEYIEELQAYQKIYPELFDIAMKIEDLPDKAGIHAAGTIIANTKIVDVAPLIRSNNEVIDATSLNLHDAETQMLVKYDFLG